MLSTLFFLAILLLLIPTALAGLIGAPLALTKKSQLEEIIKKAGIKPTDNFYELGAGSGRVMVKAAKMTKSKVIGYELSPIYYLISWLNLKINRVRRCQLFLNDFFKADLSEADVVFCFLMPKPLKRLKKKLERELKPGARVVSYCFAIEGWQAVETMKTKKGRDLPVYFYRIGV